MAHSLTEEISKEDFQQRSEICRRAREEHERPMNSLSSRLLIPVVNDELSVNENPRFSITRHP